MPQKYPLTRDEVFERYGVYRLPSDPAERMRLIRPWSRSTGPKTELGKQIASRNGFRHGLTSKNLGVRYAARLYWEQNLASAIEELRPYLTAPGATITPELRDAILGLAEGVRAA